MSRYQWDSKHPGIERLEAAVNPARQKVVSHPLYKSLDSLEAVTTFMEHHVFAVWDFMSLLKTLQRSLTCVEVPWVPTGPTASRRLVNDIVLIEESDEFGGEFISHFELYLKGMAEAGASTTAIDALIGLLRSGEPVPRALEAASVPPPAASFVAATWVTINGAPRHCQAAAFAFGREDLIPDMFDQVVKVNQDHGHKLGMFLNYLERHIEVDSDEHTPMAMGRLADLCGDDAAKWAQCEETVNTALGARYDLWNDIYAVIQGTR